MFWQIMIEMTAILQKTELNDMRIDIENINFIDSYLVDNEPIVFDWGLMSSKTETVVVMSVNSDHSLAKWQTINKSKMISVIK